MDIKIKLLLGTLAFLLFVPLIIWLIVKKPFILLVGLVMIGLAAYPYIERKLGL